MDREKIADIEVLIRPYVRRTPVVDVAPGDFGLSTAQLSFKL